MGEVYRARHEKLHREVAVKVLPAHLSESPAALARFEREAQAVAALSHPNILAIHDFGRAEGIAYAVMELLEGESLREKLEAGPLPPRKAAEHAAQVALGLAAAHEKGIVHRDLKPENLFLTRDGRLKILDFGLARQAPSGPRGEAIESPTLSRHTEPGTVLGTAGYMSPEQVRGQPADHRSDIFSLGCVLYEMLAGRRAFQRDTPAETMTAILREDPPSLTDPQRPIPPALERLLRHCLEKKPEERFESARDLAFDLASLSDSSATTAALALPPKRGARLWPWLVGAGLVLLAAAFEAGWRSAERSPGGSVGLRATFTQLTDLPGAEASPSLSPDGKTLLFVSRASGNADIYLQRVGGHNPINLTRDCAKDDIAPAFSPDGERIVFRSECEGGGIFVMGATGESRKRLTDFGHDPGWSPDGGRIAVATEPTGDPLARPTRSRLWVVEVATGEKRLMTEGDAMQPSWSPRAHRIAYWGLRGGLGETGRRDLWTIPAEAGPAVEVTNDEAVDWNPVWSPDGRHLYFSSGRGGTMNLWRVPIEEASGRPLGEPEPVTTPSRWSGGISLSRDGQRLAFVALEERSSLHRIAFDPVRGAVVGSPSLILGGSRVFGDQALSPDGQWVAFASWGLHEHLFVVRADGTGYRQLTDDGFRNRGPKWSPDGARIAFYSNRSGRYQLWAIRPDGSGLESLTATTGSVWFPLWSSDGTRLAAGGATTRLFDLRLPLNERETRALPPIAEGVAFQASSWSPDGGRLAGFGLRTDGSQAGVFVYSFDSNSFEKLADSGDGAVWLADGRRLLYADQGALHLIDRASRQSRQLLPRGTLSGTWLPFSLSKDNRWISFVQTSSEGDIWLQSLE